MTSTLIKSDSEQRNLIGGKSKTIFTKVMNYDLSVVRDRLLKDYPELSSRLEDIELLYRQYMYLCAIKPKNMSLGVPSNEVDLFWHCHIIHTRLYQNFCDDIAGYFIHHNPHGTSTTNEEKQLARNNLLNLFKIYFKDSISALVLESSKCGPNCSVDCSDNCTTCTDNCAGGGSCDS